MMNDKATTLRQINILFIYIYCRAEWLETQIYL